MKLRHIFTFIGIFILASILLLLGLYNYNFIYNGYSNNISSTNLTQTTNPITTISVGPNSSLTFPHNDYVISNINWSLYPNLSTGYIYTVYVAGPNDVIPYKFIEVQICTEVKDTENRTIIIEQLNGVAKEAKKIYGPDSSINIIGTKGGIARWFASILPNDDKIYN